MKAMCLRWTVESLVPVAAAGRLALGAASAVAAWLLAACGEFAALGKETATQQRVVPPADAPMVSHGKPNEQAVVHFKAHALNALLVPLLDDDVPPRWADPAIAMSCTALRVTVDGVAPVPHSAVPAVPFVVRWQLDHCAPLGAGMLLSGEVELLVFHDGDSYSAVVQPDDLRVTTLLDSFSLDQPFAAYTPLVAPR